MGRWQADISNTNLRPTPPLNSRTAYINVSQISLPPNPPISRICKFHLLELNYSSSLFFHLHPGEFPNQIHRNHFQTTASQSPWTPPTIGRLAPRSVVSTATTSAGPQDFSSDPSMDLNGPSASRSLIPFSQHLEFCKRDRFYFEHFSVSLRIKLYQTPHKRRPGTPWSSPSLHPSAPCHTRCSVHTKL